MEGLTSEERAIELNKKRESIENTLFVDRCENCINVKIDFVLSCLECQEKKYYKNALNIIRLLGMLVAINSSMTAF